MVVIVFAHHEFLSNRFKYGWTAVLSVLHTPIWHCITFTIHSRSKEVISLVREFSFRIISVLKIYMSFNRMVAWNLKENLVSESLNW